MVAEHGGKLHFVQRTRHLWCVEQYQLEVARVGRHVFLGRAASRYGRVQTNQALQLQEGQRATQVGRVVRHRYRGAIGQGLEVGDFFGIQAQGGAGHLQHLDQVALVLRVEGFQESTVLEHVGVQVAVHERRVELDDVGELGQLHLDAGTLQRGLHAAFELVRVRAGEEADAQLALRLRPAGHRQRGHHQGL